MAREILVPSRSGSRVKNAEALFCAQRRGTKHMAWNCPRQFRPGVEKVGFLTSPEFNPTTVWHTNTRHLWVTVVLSWLTVSRASVSMRFFKKTETDTDWFLNSKRRTRMTARVRILPLLIIGPFRSGMIRQMEKAVRNQAVKVVWVHATPQSLVYFSLFRTNKNGENHYRIKWKDMQQSETSEDKTKNGLLWNVKSFSINKN